MKNSFLIKIILCNFLILFTNYCLGQTNRNNSLPNVLPVSPTAFEFLKYGEIPVSKYTGVPNISIPIYTIRSRGLDIPISLTYHSNGFRVSEESGWTGLGWTLNPEGNIVQIIRGFDDFGPRSNRNFLDADAIADTAGNGAPNGAFTDCYNSSSMSISSKAFGISYPLPLDSTGEPPNSLLPASFMIGDKDYEPDVFQFSVLGYSGKFVLDWENETFVCLTDSRIKVEKNQGSHNQITIRLPDGHYCLFSVKEESTKERWSITGGNTNSSAHYLDGEVLSRVYKLDHIYTNQNDHIEFTYTITSSISGPLEVSSQYITYEDRGPDPLGTSSYNIPGYGSAGSELWNGKLLTIFKTKQPMSFLNKITFNKGIVLFSTSNRNDINGAKKLDKIEIKESEASSKTIKEINFDYNYFVGHSNGTSNSNSYTNYNNDDSKTTIEKTYRLKLNSVTEVGKPPYSFEYNSTQLPKKNSWATDYWGYYNGKLNNQSLHVNLYRFEYQLEAPTSLFQESSANNKSANEVYAKAAVLEKITYPTGGYTTFEYELNSFLNYNIPNYSFSNSTPFPANHISYGGGIRIRKISNFDHTTLPVSQKLYTYEGGKIMTPLQFYNKAYIPYYYYIRHYSSVTGTVWAHAYGYRRKQSSSSIIVPSTNASGSFVGYDKVTEHFIGKDSETNNIGTIETDYENHIDEGMYNVTNDNSWYSIGRLIELGKPTLEANNTRNGSVIEERIIDKDGSIIKKTVNKYGYAIRPYCATGAIFGSIYASGRGNTSPDRKYTIGFYPIRGLDSYLSKKETTIFDGTDSLTTKEEYFYNENLQLKEHRITNSDESILYNYKKYTEYGRYDPVGPVYNLSQDKTVKNGRVINSNNYSYTTPTIGAFPLNILSGTDNSVTDLQYSYDYDGKGNLQEIRGRNRGLKIKYVWDYYGKYLLLKMEGSDENSWPFRHYINAVVNASQDYSNKQALLDAVDDLRKHSSVHVTSYTYDNLIGVSSITSPKGETIYYFYDEFNRLKEIKDTQGNLLYKNEYNYKQ